MHFLPRFALPLVASAMLAAAPPAAEQIQALIDAHPPVQRGQWGALFVDLRSGEVLFSQNADSLFTPASNAKLLSSAAVLDKLGPGFRFVTRLCATAPLNNDGVLAGDLILRGGGDPTLGRARVPYDAKAPPADSLGALAELVEAAWNSGLRRVEGDVAGDDTRYPWMPFPEGWAQDDTVFGYGAPVGALTLHDNLFLLRLTAAEPGEPPRLDVDPPLPYFTFDNRAVTAAPRDDTRIYLDRRPGSRHVEIRGHIAAGRARSYEIAVSDPAAYAAYALRRLLIRRGIAVRGSFHAHHRLPAQPAPKPPEGEVTLAERESPPLAQILQVTGKVSNNLWAEIAIREAARASETDPPALIGGFLNSIDVPDTDFRLQDGSGLSRLDLVSPAALVRLLRHMAAQPDREAWFSILPVAGREGTLDSRFRRGTNGHGRVAAKTGTLSGVGALSGYAGLDSQNPVVFSVLVNNVNARSAEIRGFIDGLVALFVP
ncbi:MAG: D-alanyl-D-alanine carboxypeptidase/D-alanyl-D-alanine-endopeptidase [Bryobacteraceae bacterium]